jgi:hypothetical protein
MVPTSQPRGGPTPTEKGRPRRKETRMKEMALRRRIAVLVFTAFVALTGELATLAVMADDADARRARITEEPEPVQTPS